MSKRLTFAIPHTFPEVIRQILHYPPNYDIIIKHLGEISQEIEKVKFLKRKSRTSKANESIFRTDKLNEILKELMMRHLERDVVARLGKSEYGVGVFAFRKIVKGQQPFMTLAGPCINYHLVRVESEKVKEIDTPLNSYLSDFYLSPSTMYPIPALGPNTIDLGFYLNHSDTPNLDIKDIDECEYSVYIANRDIEPEEELTIDYCHFGLKREVIENQMPFLIGKCVFPEVKGKKSRK
jgi:SET domain-containing protein